MRNGVRLRFMFSKIFRWRRRRGLGRNTYLMVNYIIYNRPMETDSVWRSGEGVFSGSASGHLCGCICYGRSCLKLLQTITLNIIDSRNRLKIPSAGAWVGFSSPMERLRLPLSTTTTASTEEASSSSATHDVIPFQVNLESSWMR